MGPFITSYLDGRELLNDKITLLPSVDLIAALLGLSVVFGVERIEEAINATYGKKEADQIITCMNFLMKMGVKP